MLRDVWGVLAVTQDGRLRRAWSSIHQEGRVMDALVMPTVFEWTTVVMQ